MNGSLRRLLTGVIDYAGLFPPAKLSLADALNEYRRYTISEDRWILGAFCCPVKELANLAALLESAKTEANEPTKISVIGAMSNDREQWSQAREQEAFAMNEFQERVREIAEITALEVRIPSHSDLDRYYQDLQGFASVNVYAELPWSAAMADSIAATAEAEWLFLKARAGGPTPAEIPSALELGEFISGCTSLEIPFKLTGGLHHPLRHTLSNGNAEHGFINVLAAAVLALSDDLPPKQLAEIIDCKEPSHWSFEDGQFSWMGHNASIADIDNGRSLFDTFGSCSIQEPLNGLKTLGWAEGSNR